VDAPSTIAGWATTIAAVTVFLSVWTGAALSLGKQYIHRTVADVVRESIDRAMQPIQLQLITMNGELIRVREIESKLENGLTSEVARIGGVVDDIQRHFMWDGSDRRVRE